MNKKRMLILRACGHRDEKHECDGIVTQSKLYGLDVCDKCPKTNEELEKELHNNGRFDYIYLSSHGNSEGFENESKTVSYDWYNFGTLLCNSMCMNADCVVMLSCCRGGLNQVAYDLFYCCANISYIVGPRQSLTSYDMLISFNILLYNLENRKIDPIVACEKIKAATDIRFICFDRLETESEASYIMRTNKYENQLQKQANQAKGDEPLLEAGQYVPPEVADLLNDQKNPN